MLNSGIDNETVKTEVRRYVQVLETNYNEKIQAMAAANKKLKS